MDDGLIQKILAKSLGDRCNGVAAAESPDPTDSLEGLEGILYSLEKTDLIHILKGIHALSSVLSPRMALHLLVKKIPEVLEASHCSLILLDRDAGTGTVAVSHEDPDFEGVEIALDDYPEILRSLQTGHITVVENPSLDPLMHTLEENQLSRIRDVSIMVLPLVSGERVVAVLLVRKQRSEEGFTIREVRICQLMVRMVLSVLQRMVRAGIPETAPAGGTYVPPSPSTSGGPKTAVVHAALFQEGPVGVLLLDREDRILEANPRAVELLQLERETLLSLQFSDIVPRQWTEQIRKMRKLNSGGERDLTRYHFPYRARNGRESTFSIQRYAMPGEGGGTLVFFRDATKEKQMEDHLQRQAVELTAANRRLREARADLLKRNEELLATNERLDEINRTKTHFLAVATHEIRTPLSIIRGYNRFLLQERPGRLNAEQKRILEESIQSCERLLNIVNEMLDFTQVDSGKLELHKQESDVLGLLKRVFRQMKLITDREAIEFVLELPRDPVLLLHDPDRIEQVLVNLISNAIKFTPAGGMITLAAHESLEGRDGVLEISISDTGIGLSRSMQEKIFKGYHPVVSGGAGSGHPKGVGLGLAISKRIVEAHGGRIWAEGNQGEGAIFRFTLPARFRVEEKGERNLSI